MAEGALMLYTFYLLLAFGPNGPGGLLAPLWGALAAVCGVLVAIRRPHSPARAGGLHPGAR